MNDFVISMAIGLALSAPLGPIGILCLNYALSKGFRFALIAGLGAALADTFYVGIATFGLSEVSDWFLSNTLYLGLFGGALLIFLGYKIWSSPLEIEDREVNDHSSMKAFGSTFLFTLSNPFTIIAAASLISCLTSSPEFRTQFDSTLIVMGIFLGSMAWWVTLSSVGSYFRHHVTLGALQKAKKAIGMAVMLFGGFFIGYAFR